MTEPIMVRIENETGRPHCTRITADGKPILTESIRWQQRSAFEFPTVRLEVEAPHLDLLGRLEEVVVLHRGGGGRYEYAAALRTFDWSAFDVDIDSSEGARLLHDLATYLAETLLPAVPIPGPRRGG